MPNRIYWLNKGKGEGGKNAKSRTEKKEREKEKKHTNSIAWIWARACLPSVSFACLKLHHVAKETKYKVGSICEYYVTIKHETHHLNKVFWSITLKIAAPPSVTDNT